MGDSMCWLSYLPVIATVLNVLVSAFHPQNNFIVQNNY